MIKNDDFKGIITPVSTIFDADDNFDSKGMSVLIDFLIESGVNGLLFLGSGGEFSQMTYKQRKEVTEFCISYVDKRVPVLIGTGSNSTKESILLSKHAEEHGADGVIVINPYYWKLSESSLINHFTDISQSTRLPILLYNFPDVTGQDLNAEFIYKLVEKNPNIIGIKETIDCASHIREMILKVKNKYPEFKVFAGFDDYMLSTLQNGGDGAILGSSNFAPELSVNLYKSFTEGNLLEANALQSKLNMLPDIYKLDSPFLSSIKEATYLRGLNISTKVLAPAQKIDVDSIKKIKQIMKSASLSIVE